MDKTGRNALRVGDILDKTFTTQYIKLRLKHQKLLDNFHFMKIFPTGKKNFLKPWNFYARLNIVNGEYFINNKIKQGKKSFGRRRTGQHARY